MFFLKIRLEAEQEEAAQLTFRPDIRATSNRFPDVKPVLSRQAVQVQGLRGSWIAFHDSINRKITDHSAMTHQPSPLVRRATR